MWPWEHVAVAYVIFSLTVNALTGSAPRNGECLAVVAGSLFPDLIDKPLGWAFGVVPSVSLAHSVFVAVPCSLVVVASGYLTGRLLCAFGFSTGYLLHLPGDALFSTITRGHAPVWELLLWPVASPPVDPPGDFVYNVWFYFDNYRVLLVDPNNAWFLAFELALLGTAVALWVADGMPGTPFRTRFSTS